MPTPTVTESGEAMAGSDPVLISDNGAVRTITLNRPAQRNAIDMDLRIALAAAVEAADADPNIRAVVLAGAGSAFCAGGDVASMQRVPANEAIERAQLAKRVIAAIWSTGKPVLAAVDGPAIGAGAALAAACDRVIAGRGAKFAFTFINIGLCGDMGTFVSLPSRVGTARARQLLMFATALDATEALQIGLVDEVVDAGHALGKAHDDAQRLACGPAIALRTIKTMLADSGSMYPLEVFDREAHHQAQLFDTDDFAEGIAALREERKPVFNAPRNCS